MMMDKEIFRIKLENDLLKKKLKKELSEKEQLEREYRELAEFAQKKVS